MKDSTMKPVQPHENNGGAAVPMNKSTHNNTPAYPNTKPKSENAWMGYGKVPKPNKVDQKGIFPKDWKNGAFKG